MSQHFFQRPCFLFFSDSDICPNHYNTIHMSLEELANPLKRELPMPCRRHTARRRETDLLCDNQFEGEQESVQGRLYKDSKNPAIFVSICIIDRAFERKRRAFPFNLERWIPH